MTDYFEFFGLPQRFALDREVLRKIYVRNSRTYHPDFFTLDSSHKQDEVLSLSSLNNEAYRILSDDRRRMKYLLELNGILQDGKESIPQSFLMEMMDFNEQLMEAQMSENKDGIARCQEQLAALEGEMEQEGLQLMHLWDTTPDDQTLEGIRDIYLKQQYIRRIRDRLQGDLPEL